MGLVAKWVDIEQPNKGVVYESLRRPIHIITTFERSKLNTKYFHPIFIKEKNLGDVYFFHLILNITFFSLILNNI